MSSLVCVFGERMKSFRDNYLDMLFERQDVQIAIFTNLFYISYRSFNLRQNDNIDFSASFFLKLFFSK